MGAVNSFGKTLEGLSGAVGDALWSTSYTDNTTWEPQQYTHTDTASAWGVRWGQSLNSGLSIGVPRGKLRFHRVNEEVCEGDEMVGLDYLRMSVARWLNKGGE